MWEDDRKSHKIHIDIDIIVVVLILAAVVLSSIHEIANLSNRNTNNTDTVTIESRTEEISSNNSSIFSITEVYTIDGVDEANIAILYDEEYDQEYIIVEETNGKFAIIPRIIP